MLSRALGLATVMVVISSLAAERVLAQAQNLEAGKSPSQIFAGTCTLCHKSPRGLLKTVAAGSLPGFLRQHYTTSSDMAGVLASYLVSNGATDARFAGTQPKGAKEGAKDGAKEGAKEGTKDGIKETSREATRDAPPDQLERISHRQQRPGVAPLQEGLETRHASRPDADTQPPSQGLSERGPEGRKMSAKQKLSRRGKPGDELPRTEPASGDVSRSEAKESAKTEPGKPDGDKPNNGESRSDSARAEPAKEPGGETSALRADPVPPVTPAPPGGPSPATSAATSSGGSETPAMSFAAPTPAPELTVSAPPPLPRVPPAGPPAPPISQ
jgi:hypothetical protein